MPRAQKNTGKTRHDPLHLELAGDEINAKYGKISQPGKRKKARRSGEDGEGETILDPRTSQKIFELARDQQAEVGMPEDEEEEGGEEDERPRMGRSAFDEEDEDEDEEVGELEEEDFQIDSGDMETMDALRPANANERKTLADLIFAKLESGETEVLQDPAVIRKAEQNLDRPDPTLGLDPRVIESYTRLGTLLASYKSGPLPKLFKVIPSLPAWARLLAITAPENWTPHAVREATRVFISGMKPAQAELFLRGVVLDKVREDIGENKRLNVQYYEAMKKALYKPSAFFKGFIFPLLDTGCTLREAAIIASVLAKKKVPVLHSSAALLRIAEMDYTGPNSLFIRVLIDKKHQLPYRVVDALVFHFIRLSNTYKAKNRGETDKLPVLWHQSLLVFVQRYGSDLTPDQKDALLDVVRASPHPQIGPEVRRELINSVMRGEPRGEEVKDIVMGR